MRTLVRIIVAVEHDEKVSSEAVTDGIRDAVKGISFTAGLPSTVYKVTEVYDGGLLTGGL